MARIDHTFGVPAPAEAAPPAPRRRAAAAWPRVVGRSAAVRRLENDISRVGDFDCSVLVTGETGCGKEEVARAIYAAGNRSAGPFVAVNCGGVVATLAESLLFGHVKGSFTGADESAGGAFRAAHGGILFLDEVGEMPLDLQPKLLRALQQREVVPVGSSVPVAIDVQVVAATNRDLEAEVEAGRFREDLLYRLNTVHIVVPPLRDRVDDIPLFIEHFSDWFADRFEMPRWRPTPDVLERLLRHAWPGNVRELSQLVQRIYIFGDRVDEVIDEALRRPGTAGHAASTAHAAPSGHQAAPDRAAASGWSDAASRLAPPAADGQVLAARAAPAERHAMPRPDPVLPVCNLIELRKIAVRQALATAEGRIGEAASLLGVSRNTMTKLVAEACPDRAGRQGRRPPVKPR